MQLSLFTIGYLRVGHKVELCRAWQQKHNIVVVALDSWYVM